MEEILKFDTVSQYNTFNNNETLHPLVSVVDLSKAGAKIIQHLNLGFYTVFLKEIKCGNMRYGCHTYDYQEGTLVFIAPGQVLTMESYGQQYQPQGYALVFHPDLLRGTSLGRHIGDYTFFSYEIYEALHLSESERKMVYECFSKISFELTHAIDQHSKTLIITNIELFLNYCRRFYDRQFITRDQANKGILHRFEDLLNDYFQSEKPRTTGLPSVALCAEYLHLSANYFGDLVKKETGKTAQEYIQLKIMDRAKEMIFNPDKSLAQIAYELGFKYPQHFSRAFKQHTGYAPHEYRSLNYN